MSEFERKPKRFGNGGGRPGGFNRGGGRPDFKNRGDRGDKPMFDAVCANCQKTCQVPFRPNGNKPVYCNDCFRSMRDENEGSYSRPDVAPRRDFAPAVQKPQADSRLDGISAQINALHQKMDKILAALNGNKTEVKPEVKKEEFSLDKAPVAKVEKVKVASKAKAPAKKKVASKKK